MSTTDPLDGLPRPPGSPAELHALASTWTAAGTALGHTAEVLLGMVGRLLAQSWSGQAALACASACSRDAAAVATAADAHQVGGAALQRFASQLAAAQASYDKARRLADQALADEQAAQARHSTDLLALLTAEPSPLRGLARAQAQQAVDDARRAATAAGAVLDDTLAPYRPKPAPAAEPPPEEHHWYSPVTHFADGVWDGVKDPVVMVGGLVGLHGDLTDSWGALGGGLWHGVTHPLDLGKAVIGWDDLSHGRYAHWGGELLPGAVAAFFTGGAAAAAKGADGAAALSRTGKALDDLTDAEKAAALARGEALVPGSVGNEAAARFVTPEGRLDYSYRAEDELENFRTVTANGAVTLEHDLWLANLHDGSAALNAGRSLKYGAPLDEVLAHTRGGYLQRLALVPQWGPRTDLSLLQLPAGTTVNLTSGTAAAQVSRHTLTLAGHSVALPTGLKVGGGTQVLLHEVDRQWVVWTGQAPWAAASPHLLRGAAAGSTAFGVVRAPDALADLAP